MKLKFKYQLVGYYIIVCIILIMVVAVYYFWQVWNDDFMKVRDKLVEHCERIYREHKSGVRFEMMSMPGDLRLTVIDTSFWVVYDSSNSESIYQDNHNTRDEVITATVNGEGTLLRLSPTFNEEYLYYIKKYPDFYLRVSKPYTHRKNSIFGSEEDYVTVIHLLIIVLVYIFFRISRTLTRPLNAFNEFFEVVQRGEKDFSKIIFPNDEYGDIGRKIVSTYDQLEKAKSFKQQLTHNIAHELKTPLTGIRAYLETILQDKEMSQEQMRKFVERAYKQSIRLTSLVDDVAVLNKLDEQSKYYTIEEVNIADCLEEIKEELALKLEKNNSEIRSYISSTLSIRSNYGLLYSLFKNLMDNTLEHAGKGASIVIRAGIFQNSGDSRYGINFVYHDSGKGIPNEDTERLFERFYRVEDGRSRKSGGSGLGLAIVKNAVTFHKGDITVENDPNGGITFRFSLMSL